MRKKGFTLIELLMVIVILTIVTLIAVPSIFGVVAEAKKKAFADNAKLILKSISFKQSQDENFDPTTITESNLKSILLLNADNYKDLVVTIVDNKVTIYIVGQNDWEDLIASGNRENISVSEDETIEFDSIWNFGGEGTEVINDIASEGTEYLIAGNSNSTTLDLAGLNYGSTDAIIAKYNANDGVEWKNNFGGTLSDNFNYATLAPDGFIAVGGSSSTDYDLTGLNKGAQDAIIVKYNQTGNLDWNYNFGGTGDDYFESVLVVNDGYIAVGASNSTTGDLAGLNKGGYDFFIVKLDFDGNLTWVKTFGGTGTDIAKGITGLSDGVVILGESNSTTNDLVGLNKGLVDTIITKYDFSGTKIWAKNFGGAQNDNASEIKRISDGFLVVGYSRSLDGDLTGLHYGATTTEDGFLIRYDLAGNIVWKRNFGGTNSDFFTDVVVGFNGYIVSGYGNSTNGDLLNRPSPDPTYNDTYFVRYDFNGNIKYVNTLVANNEDKLLGVIMVYKYYIAVGTSATSNGIFTGANNGGTDIIFAKYKY